MATTNITMRMDEELKAQLQELVLELGMDMTTFFTLSAKQAVREQKIPFEISLKVPNSETVEAIKEMEDILNGVVSAKRYSSTKELFEDLEL